MGKQYDVALELVGVGRALSRDGLGAGRASRRRGRLADAAHGRRGRRGNGTRSHRLLVAHELVSLTAPCPPGGQPAAGRVVRGARVGALARRRHHRALPRRHAHTQWRCDKLENTMKQYPILDHFFVVSLFIFTILLLFNYVRSARYIE